MTLAVDRLREGSQGLAAVHQADTIAGSEDLYRERLRPQFHFSSRRGWLNDPNGLVYHKGEYHLFYQHNPYGWAWGNMHWGHAVSTDLVHWQELPIAIYPHRFGDWAFSGSAVVDRQNTAGFKKGDEDVLVAAYTSTGRGECIVYSHDRGRTFTEYDGNPVVKHSGRDPKILWHAPGKHWVMAVYDEADDKRGIAFYTSPDLKKWEQQSKIDGYFECPDIFELPVDGDRSRRKWVLVRGRRGLRRRRVRRHARSRPTATSSRSTTATASTRRRPSATSRPGRPADPDRLGPRGHARHAVQPVHAVPL